MKFLNKTKKYIMLFMVIIAAFFVIIGSEKNKKVEALTLGSGTKYFYFDNSNTGWAPSSSQSIQLMIGHSSWSAGYVMSKVTNTNLYFVSVSGWTDATELCIIYTNGTSAWSSTGEGMTNRRQGAINYSAVFKSSWTVNGGAFVKISAASGSNNSTLSLTYLGTSYSSLNTVTHTVGTKVNVLNSGGSYVTGKNGGSATVKGYAMSSNSSAGTSKTSNAATTGTTTISSVAQSAILTYTATEAAGYQFVGWYNSSGTSLSTANPYTYNASGSTATTVYAYFKARAYTVTLNNQGATTAGSTSVTATYNQAMPSLTMPQKTGYTFGGYYTGTSGSGTQYYTETGASARSYALTSGTTLYAKWTPNTYTVAYDSNKPAGASSTLSGSTASSSHTYDVSKALTANGFTLPGYTFAGWNTKADGTGTNYTDSQSVSNLTTTNGATVTLYAKWTANTYTISFDFDGGNSGTESLSVTFDGSVANITKPTKTGYTFAGYYTSKQDSGLEDPNDAIGTKYFDLNGQFVLSGTWTNASDITLYACWIPESVTVIYNPMGGISINNDVVKVPGTVIFNTTTKEGYQFAGWYFDQELTNSAGLSYQAIQEETITLYAKWTPNTYTVIYDGNKPTGASSIVSGSTANSSHTYDEGKALNPNGFILPGYTFAGWATSANGDVAYANSASVSNLTATNGGTVTLYAKWTANTYTVIFNANGGSGTMANQSFTYDVSENLTTNIFTKTHYHVIGWSTTSDGDVEYNDGASVSNLTSTNGATVTLYAVWAPNIYTVTFNANSGEGTMSPQNFTYGIPQAISLNTFTETGYTFAGWTKNLGDTTPKYLDGDVISVESNMTLYALWRENVYYVDFDGNGGTGSMNRIRLTYTDDSEDTDALPANKFVKTGYTFLGWSKDENAVSPTYTDQQEVRNLSSIDNDTVTLYAVWQAITYKIIYHSNDHFQQTITFEYTYDVTYSIKSFNDCSFTGKPELVFELWSTSKDNSTGISYDALEQFSNMADEQDEEVHLYAIYQNNATEDAIFIRFMAGMEEINSYYSTPNQQLTNIPDMSQYVFNGWIDNNDVYYPIDATLTPNNDIIYYAIFVSDLTSQIRSTIEFNYRQVYTGSGASKNDVFFVDTYGWDLDPSSVDIYCYVDGDTGYQMTYAGKNEDNKNVYKYTLNDLASGHTVYFGCGSHKTSAVDVNYVTQYSVSSKIKYIYYSADSSWGTVYCYAWNKDTNQNNGAFPGKAMTYVYTNSYGQKVCRYEIGSTDFDMVIFTNGSGSQSSDISVSNLTNDNNGFYGLSGDTWTPTTSDDSLADDTISSLVKDSGEDLFKGEQLINFGSVKLYTGLICNSGTVNDAIKSSHEITKIGFFYKEVGKDQEYKPLTHYQAYNSNISSKSQCTSYIDYVKKMNADLDVTYKTQYTIALFVVLDVNGEEIELNVGEKTISVQEIVEIYQGMLGDLISSHEEAFNILGAK